MLIVPGARPITTHHHHHRKEEGNQKKKDLILDLTPATLPPAASDAWCSWRRQQRPDMRSRAAAERIAYANTLPRVMIREEEQDPASVHPTNEPTPWRQCLPLPNTQKKAVEGGGDERRRCRPHV